MSIFIYAVSTNIRTEPTVRLVAVIGDQLRLTCIDAPLTAANAFSWYRANRTLLNADTISDPRYHIDTETGALHIDGARPTDSDYYKCVVPLAIDEIVVAPTVLTVRRRPRPQQQHQQNQRQHRNELQALREIFVPANTAPTQWNRRLAGGEAAVYDSAGPAALRMQDRNYEDTSTTTTTTEVSWADRSIRTNNVDREEVSRFGYEQEFTTAKPTRRRTSSVIFDATSVHVQPTQSNNDDVDDSSMRLHISWTPAESFEDGNYYRILWLQTDAETPQWYQQRVDDMDRRYVDVIVPKYGPYLARVRLAGGSSAGDGRRTTVDVFSYPSEGKPQQAPTGLRKCQQQQSQQQQHIGRRGGVLSSAASVCFEWNAVETNSLNGRLSKYRVYTWHVNEHGQRSEDRVTEWTPKTDEVVEERGMLRVTVAGLAEASNNIGGESFARVAVFNGRFEGPSSADVQF